VTLSEWVRLPDAEREKIGEEVAWLAYLLWLHTLYSAHNTGERHAD
jgi:hypothetical protein